MSVTVGAATSRMFVAHPHQCGFKMASKTTAAYGGRSVVGSRQGFSADVADEVFRYGGVVVPLAAFGAYDRWSPALHAASSAKLCS
jgi:hypothetical protein